MCFLFPWPVLIEQPTFVDKKLELHRYRSVSGSSCSEQTNTFRYRHLFLENLQEVKAEAMDNSSPCSQSESECSLDGAALSNSMAPPSPVSREQLQKRIDSLNQHNKVLKVELDTYKIRVKQLQEENKSLRQASVNIVSSYEGGATPELMYFLIHSKQKPSKRRNTFQTRC